ncbi:MAG: DUF1273 domain-containing protein [Ruminococcus sp.]|nr:DUF1273 domain-containing protein [Ruminococcus sp.]
MCKPLFCTISGINPCSFGLDEKNPDCITMKLAMVSKINELYLSGVTNFVCNCEMGIPLWAAEAALCVRTLHPVRLHIAIPYENQVALWADEWRERYFNIHEQADSVTMLQKQFEEDCYINCDRLMIDHSDLLLWVGSRGGFITEYTKRQGKHVILIAAR